MKKKQKYHQGRYVPRNPAKYIGDINRIIYRSGWELKVFKNLDNSSKILKWNSEEIIVPYVNPLDGKVHRYFTDIWLEEKAEDGSIKTRILEIKPYAQTIQPKKQKRKTRRYIKEMETYITNKAKWAYATKYCKQRGWNFQTITERELKIK